MLVAVTDNRRRDYAALNGARAIAAYLVVATHAGFESGLSLSSSPWAPFLARANFGVTIFFLLSGFLLSRRFLLDDSTLTAHGLSGFWRRRAVRIFPAYWLAIIGALALLTVRHTTGQHWAFYLLLIHPYVAMPIDPTLSQMWTLAVEVSFYAILPLLFWLSRRFGSDRRAQSTWLIVSMSMAALVANLVVHRARGRRQPGGAVDAVVPRLVRARDRAGGPDRLPERPGPVARRAAALGAVDGDLLGGGRVAVLDLDPPASVVRAAWSLPRRGSGRIRHYLFAGSAFFLLLPLVVGHERWPERLLGNRVMTWLGEVSYGVYLWQLGLLSRAGTLARLPGRSRVTSSSCSSSPVCL